MQEGSQSNRQYRELLRETTSSGAAIVNVVHRAVINQYFGF